MVKFDQHSFLNSVSNFEMPSEFSHEDLIELLNEYPAFNSLQLINAVLTNKENPELFQKDLNKIATKVIDRAILHDYIFKDKFTYVSPALEEENQIELAEQFPEKTKDPEVLVETETLPTENVNIPNEEVELTENLNKEIVEEHIELAQEEQLIVEKVIEEIKVEEVEEKIFETIQFEPTTPAIEKVQINEPEAIEAKDDIENLEAPEEIIEKKNANDSPSSKNENRDLAFKNLSADLFNDKLKSNTSSTSEKEQKRLEAMKKLQEELFKQPLQKDLSVEKETLTTSENKLVQEITEEPVSENVKTKEEIQNDRISKLLTEIPEEKKPIEAGQEKPIIEEVVELDQEIEKPTIEEPKESIKEKLDALVSKFETTEKPIETEKIEKSTDQTLESTKSEDNPVEKILKENRVDDFVFQRKETHLDKIEKLKAKIRANRLKEKEEEERKLMGEKPVSIPSVIHYETKANEEKAIANTNLIEEENETIVDSNTKHSLTFQDFFKNGKLEKQEKEKKEKAFTPKTPHAEASNFLNWLKEIKTDITEVSETTETKIEEQPEEKIEELKDISEPAIEKIVVEEEIDEIEEKEDLIPFDQVSAIEHEMHQEIKKSSDPLDDFISKQITKKKKVRTKNTTKTISNVGLISETLAEILVIQQKYTEAIEVYNTLSLKYPEKSIYFAHQIEKIKNY